MKDEHKHKLSNALVGRMPKNQINGGNYGNIKSGWYMIANKKMFFRSKWEANYALYLNFLKKNKNIKKWTYEKDIYVFHKIKFGTRSYRPDFKIINNDNSVEYHEVKGYMNNKSKTKLKRMAKYYPKVKIILIQKEEMMALNQYKSLLKFY